MTLDHSRDFLHFPGPSPLDMQTTTVILFFTRWITHFCAPGFVFLSGVSVYLAGQRRTKRELSIFLLKRGLWLILSDILIISLLFTFDLQYHLIILEVLWATGFGMIILALMLRAPMPVITIVALIILFSHNVLTIFSCRQAGWQELCLKCFYRHGACLSHWVQAGPLQYYMPLYHGLVPCCWGMALEGFIKPGTMPPNAKGFYACPVLRQSCYS